jgi:AcrR family transcriptional regulator
MKEDGFHHGNLRSALIDAGLRSVEARGAGEVSLRDLAREVGVSPTAAYRHFADKDALFAAIADRGFHALAEASAAAVGVPDPHQRLFALSRAYTGFAADHPQLYRLMFAEPLDMGRVAELSEGSSDAYRPMRDAVTAALGKGADEGEVTDAIVRLWSVLHGYVTLRLANRLPRLATVEDRFDAVLRPVIASLGKG